MPARLIQEQRVSQTALTVQQLRRQQRPPWLVFQEGGFSSRIDSSVFTARIDENEVGEESRLGHPRLSQQMRKAEGVAGELHTGRGLRLGRVEPA